MRYVSITIKERIGIITICRPSALNALNKCILLEMSEILDGIDKEQIRCLIITGEGMKAFAAGADIQEMADLQPEEAYQFSVLGNEVFLKIEHFEIPVIAAVNGFALGGGCELALSCDIRIASTNARFGQPETGLGITPGFGGTQRLARIIGMGNAKELIFTGGLIDAERAERVGLVNHVYKSVELMEEAEKMAHKIAGNAPIAVRRSKVAINRGINLDMPAAVKLEETQFAKCFRTVDQKAGMKAFLVSQKKKIFMNR